MMGVSTHDRWLRAAVLAAGILVGGGLYAIGLEFAAMLVLPQAIVVLLGRQRPAFLVDGRTFTAVLTRWVFVAQAGGIVVAMAMIGWLRDERDMPTTALLVCAAGLLAAWLLIGASMVRRLPGVVLTPDGIIRRSLFRSRFTRWDELSGPVVLTRWESVLTFHINGRKERMIFARLETDYRFVADAIEYYRTHPEHRAAIGTMEEHLRLNAALREWYEAYWRWRRAVHGG